MYKLADISTTKKLLNTINGISHEKIIDTISSVNVVGESVTINNTNDGFIDEITLEGNTIGGGGTPETPIAIQSVESPISLVNCGKNLFKPFGTGSYTNRGITVSIDDDYVISANGTCTQEHYPEIMYKFDGTGSSLQDNVIIPFDSGSQYTITVKDITTRPTNYSLVVRYIVDNVQLSYSFYGARSFTFPVGTAGLVRVYLYFAEGAIASDYKFTIQLEKGSTATEYEPYQGTTLSIPIKDTNGNDIPLRRAGTAYDSVYKENGKWYATVKIAKATSSVTNAKPNSTYLGTTGNGTADGTGAITVTGEVIYELATPEIIELHADTATALESLKTYKGTTNIFGTNTVNPILDVTELAMGTGTEKYVMLVDINGNSLIPTAKGDSILMRDGKTMQQHLDAIYALLNT